MSCGSAEIESIQITEIRRDGFNLRFGQVVRDRLHDSRVVRLCRILTALLAPVQQLLPDVVMELACQTRKCVGAFGVWPVPGSAGGNLSTGNRVFIDVFPGGHELLWRNS